MPPGRRTRHLTELRGGFGKIACQARAKIREGTACKEESEGERPAFVPAQADGLSQLVGKLVIGEQIPLVQRLDGAGNLHGRRGGQCFRGFLAQGDALNPAFLAGDDEAKGNGVAGFQSAQLFRVADFEGHGHGSHVIGDDLVLDDDGFAVRLQLPDQAVDNESLFRRWRGDGLFVARGQNQQGPQAATEGAAGDRQDLYG